jgi:hypothetical protein
MKYSRSAKRPSTTRQIENWVRQIHGTRSTVMVGMNHAATRRPSASAMAGPSQTWRRVIASAFG